MVLCLFVKHNNFFDNFDFWAKSFMYNFVSQIGNFTTHIAINSRMWAGVHFQDAIDSIKPIATRIGKMAAKLVLKYANAEPAPVPATAR